MQNHHGDSNHETRFRSHESFGNTASQHASIIRTHLGNHGKECNDTGHRTEQAKQRSNRTHGRQKTHTAFKFRLFTKQRLLQGAFRIFALVAGAVQHSEQDHRKTRFLLEAKASGIFVVAILYECVQFLHKAASQMSTVSQHQEPFQAKEQCKDCHKRKRIHHDSALLEERLEFLVPGKFLCIGNGVLDCLVLQNIERDIHHGAATGLRHGLLDTCRHLGRKRRIPFKNLSLQGTRTEQGLHIAIVLRHFAKEDRSQAQAVHVHVGAGAHLRHLAAIGLRIRHFVAEQQVIHKALHGTDSVRHFLVGLACSLAESEQSTVHAHRIVAHNIAKSLVDRKLDLRIQGIVSGFLGLGAFFGFTSHILARHNFFAHATKIRRKLGIATIEFARLRLMFFGQLRFGIALAPMFRLKLFKRIGLLQTDAGQGVHFALQVADFFHLQRILDSRLVLGGDLLFAGTRPRPRKSGGSTQQQDKSHIHLIIHLSPPTTERLTGRFTIWGGFLACFTSIASRTAARSSRFRSSFQS